MHVEEHLVMSCCKTGNDALVFYLLDSWWNFLNYEICLELFTFVPVVQIFALRL